VCGNLLCEKEASLTRNLDEERGLKDASWRRCRVCLRAISGAHFAAASLVSFWWAHSPGGEEVAAMFGSFALGTYGYVAPMLVCAAVALLTGLLSREIVIRHLRTLP
jgi:hypothetical protein